MKASSLNEIRKELNNAAPEILVQLCVSLARYKKENKELLTYLLFEASDESSYIKSVKQDVDEMFDTVPKGNVYFVKKSIRKILRFLNKQIKYSGLPETELELRIHFCLQIKKSGIPLHAGTVLGNLYGQQQKKIESVLARLPEDLQYDYDREIKML